MANAEDAGAAAANATAINLMLASGARRVELDDKARFINSTRITSYNVCYTKLLRMDSWSAAD